LEKIFFILIKKFKSEFLKLINYFKYKLKKYFNYKYSYIKIRFNYIKQIRIKSENIKENKNRRIYKIPKFRYLYLNKRLSNQILNYKQNNSN
jgi:hypothetical protein